jgi:heme A synthase
MRAAPGLLTFGILWHLFSRWSRLQLKTKIGIVSIPVLVSMLIACGITGFAGGWPCLVLLIFLAVAICTIPDYDDPIYQ